MDGNMWREVVGDVIGIIALAAIVWMVLMIGYGMGVAL